VDGMFVGQGVGEVALGAVNIAMPFINFIFALSVMFGVGVSTLVAIHIGRGEIDRANQIFTFNTLFLLGMGLFITIVSVLNVKKIAYFLGASENNIGFVTTYLAIIMVFSCFFILSYSFEVMVKTDGFPILSTVGVSLSALCNIVLDYILVIKLDYGIAGAAIATGISQLALTILLLFHFISKRSTLKFVKVKLDFSIYKKIIPIGASDCIHEASSGFIIFIFNQVILSTLGDVGSISYTVLSYLNLFVLMTMIGVSQGMQPLVSFYYGRDERKTVNLFFRLAIITGVISSLIIFIGTQIFAPNIISMFIIDPIIAANTVPILRVFSFVFLLMGFNIILSGFFAAIERPKLAFIISFCRGIVVISFTLFSLSLWIGEWGIWISPFVSELICFTLSFILYKKTKIKSPLI
ncbi:MAG: MATE family efflux transporter, partial [Oscillospiraceae bacterium]